MGTIRSTTMRPHKCIQIKRYLTQRNKISLSEFFKLRDKLKVQKLGSGRSFPCYVAREDGYISKIRLLLQTIQLQQMKLQAIDNAAQTKKEQLSPLP